MSFRIGRAAKVTLLVGILFMLLYTVWSAFAVFIVQNGEVIGIFATILTLIFVLVGYEGKK